MAYYLFGLHTSACSLVNFRCAVKTNGAVGLYLGVLLVANEIGWFIAWEAAVSK